MNRPPGRAFALPIGPVYFPVRFAVGASGVVTAQSVGYDFASESFRREAIEEALVTGRVTASRPVGRVLCA